ncbi:hypothetical protein TEA_013847 [Camellia sinensis var. sinensis]|uniref:Serine/threonine-protein phosphatase 2A 55 kDa regulatory subunit B n=1 Tax=Camellia sinensis var. sinensis TaxID=542762 RepID=A0A4S4EGW5_CAMSN|nr:hypothetical protein TEA_013847 [Camellia sinensis var. sinensis]
MIEFSYTTYESLQDADIISSIEFEKSGDYLAVGDRGGRIVIFERKANKDSLGEHHTHLEKLDFVDTHHPEFQYKTEFQSHEPEFDYLKSLEIEEKINKVRWCATPNGSLFILSTNDKTIKLWKVKEHKVKKVKEMDFNPFVCPENALLAASYVSGQHKPSFGNGYFLEWTEKMTNNTSPSHEGDTEVANIGDGAPARCRKVYGHAHDFNINSISNNSDGETFISADDLRINLWNLEVSDQCFNIVDMKPSNMEDLTALMLVGFHGDSRWSKKNPWRLLMEQENFWCTWKGWTAVRWLSMEHGLWVRQDGLDIGEIDQD